MKLNEVAQKSDTESKIDKIKDILKSYDFEQEKLKKITVRDNNLIDFTFGDGFFGGFYFGDHLKQRNITKLPWKTGIIYNGYFKLVDCNKLESLEGCPEELKNGDLVLSACTSLTSLKGITKVINGNCAIMNCKKLSSFDYLPERVNGEFKLLLTPLVKNYLAIFNIDGIKKILVQEPTISRILNKHYKDDQNVAACQEDLIAGGFEEYAEF